MLTRWLCLCFFQTVTPEHTQSPALLYFMCIFMPLQVQSLRFRRLMVWQTGELCCRMMIERGVVMLCFTRER